MKRTELFWKSLQREGRRLTRNRVAVFEVIKESNQPMSYEEIKEALGEHNLFPDRATIYRELNFLLDHHIICRLQLEKGGVRYEVMPQGHHHHVVCLKCEAVERVVLENDVAVAERVVARKNKFKILRHSLEFYGLCQKCQ